MAEHNELGKWGEDIAVEYLLDKQYRIVARDWKLGKRDIDIIAYSPEGYLVFVEVKTRQSNALVRGIEAVDTHQIDMLREIISKGIDCCYSTLVTYGCLTVHAERIMAKGIVKRGIEEVAAYGIYPLIRRGHTGIKRTAKVSIYGSGSQRKVANVPYRVDSRRRDGGVVLLAQFCLCAVVVII